VYPHRIFEVGKVAYRDDGENYGTSTRQYAGFLHAGGGRQFQHRRRAVTGAGLLPFQEYGLEESDDSRFIPGRAAAVLYQGKPAGVFGEIHPEVLENWGITMPAPPGSLTWTRCWGGMFSRCRFRRMELMQKAAKRKALVLLIYLPEHDLSIPVLSK
jgi:hypothetical protein